MLAVHKEAIHHLHQEGNNFQVSGIFSSCFVCFSCVCHIFFSDFYCIQLISVFSDLVLLYSRTIYLVPVRDHRYEIGASKQSVRDHRLLTEDILKNFFVVEEPLL